MPPEAVERRLAAIMFTDIVGYTALMAQDEEAGRRARDRHEAVVRPMVERYHGEWVERTGDSRWWQNLERDPNCRVRLLGIDYPVRVEFVTGHEEKVRIDDAFVEKYGWLERILFRQERGETHENYARLHRGEVP